MNARCAAVISILGLSCACLAQPGGLGEPDANGFWWSTIGAVGNAPYKRDNGSHSRPRGRGSVDYEYRVSRFEVRTDQWMRFVNTFSTQGDKYIEFGWPLWWGAEPDPAYKGPGVRWQLRNEPDAAWLPVAGITWHDAALYANWMHNDQSSDPSSLETGAYDTSTWGFNPDGTFTDDPTHLPGAKYWIPTYDESIKASYYDPEANGGAGGWWFHPNGSDEPYHGGPPPAWGGDGESSAADFMPGFEEIASVPLGAYPDSQTPWGLFDISGGAQEWLEEIARPSAPRERLIVGSAAGTGTEIDLIGWAASASPDRHSVFTGLRLVSSIPSPSWGGVLVLWFFIHERKRKV